MNNLLFILLQSQVTTITETGQADQEVSVLELVLKGGFFIVPLALLSIIAVYIIIERTLTIKSAGKNPTKMLSSIKERVLDGDIKGAISQANNYDTPMARMILKGLQRIGSPLKDIEASIENVGKIEIYQLEKNLNLLATISGAAPMIGFLGTVTGMIQAFIAIAQEEGSVSPKLLSAGIYEAMITTVAGLVVGIIAYIGYNYLVGMVQKVIHRMEYTSLEFLDILHEPAE